MAYRHIHTLNSDLRLPKQKTVIVLGMGRGGTSAVAGALRELGVTMPLAHPLKHEWSPVRYDAIGNLDLKGTIRTIRRYDREHDIWGWKSPKDAFIFDQFQSYIRNPVLIMVYRNMLDTCLSGAKYGEFSWEICAEDYAAVQMRLAKMLMYTPHPVAALAYETLILAPSLIIKELSDWLQLGATDERMAAAQAFISSGSGYRSVSAEPHIKEFDAEEVAGDRADIQARLYARAIEGLESSISALVADMNNAGLILADLLGAINELIDLHRTLLHPYVENRLPMEMFSLGEDEFVNALFVDDVVKNIPTIECDDLELQLNERTRSNECYLKLLKEAYDRTRDNYRGIIRQRIKLQQQMDSLASKRELIKKLIH